jgi:hypothetical protein
VKIGYSDKVFFKKSLNAASGRVSAPGRRFSRCIGFDRRCLEKNSLLPCYPLKHNLRQRLGWPSPNELGCKTAAAARGAAFGVVEADELLERAECLRA